MKNASRLGNTIALFLVYGLRILSSVNGIKNYDIQNHNFAFGSVWV
jgi:hypothetical protein